MRYFIIALMIVVLSGCSSTPSSDPGWGKIDVTTIEVVENKDDNTVTTTTTNYNLDVKQPENPEEPATIVLDLPDGTRVETGTGSTYDIGKAIAAVAGLKPVTYAGIALFIIGAIIGIVTKGRQLLWAIGFGLAGIALIILAFIMPQYPFVFLALMIAAILGAGSYGVYMLRKHTNTEQALDETIETVDGLKTKLSPEEKEEVFKNSDGIVSRTQSRTTQRIIDKKRLKNK